MIYTHTVGTVMIFLMGVCGGIKSSVTNGHLSGLAPVGTDKKNERKDHNTHLSAM